MKPQKRRAFELEEAIRKALSILGEGKCRYIGCEGCEVEREEVIDALKGVLTKRNKGIEL